MIYIVSPRHFGCLVLLLIVASACRQSSGLPTPESKEYRNLVAAFYVGLAGLQTGEDTRAKEKLTLATQIAPGEPASWANLGLFDVRQQEFDAAYEKVEKARSLAPDNSQIEALLGFIESKRGKVPEAIAHFKKAADLDSKNLKALYALAQETERQSTETSDADAQKLLESILVVKPDNAAVLLDVIRLAAKRGASESLQKALAKLSEKSASWPGEAQQQLVALRQTASSNVRAAAAQSAFLKNVLARVPDYRQSLNAVKTPPEFVGDPFTKFIKLPSPSSEPASPDMGLKLEEQSFSFGNKDWSWIGNLTLANNNKTVLLTANTIEAQIVGGQTFKFPGGAVDSTLNRNSILLIDFNYDFRTDLVFTGVGGLFFYKQNEDGRFIDVTSSLKLSASALKGGNGLWAIDYDLDGDLDILLTTSEDVILLRNNGDGTFTEIRPFEGLRQIATIVQADIDADGDPDYGLLTSGTDNNHLVFFRNERLGQYKKISATTITASTISNPPPDKPENVRLNPPPIPDLEVEVVGLGAGDMNGDGVVDFVVETIDGKFFRLVFEELKNQWSWSLFAQGDSVAELPFRYGDSLIIVDLDNNGALDLIGRNSEILLNDGKGGFQKAATLNQTEVRKLDEGKGTFREVAVLNQIQVREVADLNADGRLDLIGIKGIPYSGEFTPIQLINRGTKNYHSQTIRTRAAKSTGDQRINSFGLGGEIEIRSGLLTQKQVITSPLLHFGLGENTQTDVARIVWPNGSVQAEFELKADQPILAEQRLKGSCPMLFAWDGKQISYVKDTAPWSPALGLHINAQVVAGIGQTEEWFRIRGDQLVPRDGIYDLRVTAELWETYYIDHYSLMVVDHPSGTEVFTDERFAVPAPPLRLYATSATKPLSSAKDDRGEDVSPVVHDLDQKYLDSFGKGKYQGITRDHWVELELPADASTNKPLYLIGHGFLHPTDGSINVAYGQTSYPPPQGLCIEVPDANGQWKVAKSGLGFPAGKLKHVVLDLGGIVTPANRRFRLRTNMEIYWDKLEWAEGIPETSVKTQRVNLSAAALRYRGFSAFTQANDASPEIPNYNQLAGTAQKWRDLIGYYTRHGEVRELLEKIDDRILIMNAGDELRLQFAALPPPANGWTRDYVMIGDGWIKDGDLNSTFSKTVLPLPYHGMKGYNVAPQRLEDDPAYQLHPEDWQSYHTRYVTPDSFRQALR